MLLSKCVQTDFSQPSTTFAIPFLNPPETHHPPVPVVYDVFCPDDDYDTAEARQREAERKENVRKKENVWIFAINLPILNAA